MRNPIQGRIGCSYRPKLPVVEGLEDRRLQSASPVIIHCNIKPKGFPTVHAILAPQKVGATVASTPPIAGNWMELFADEFSAKTLNPVWHTAQYWDPTTTLGGTGELEAYNAKAVAVRQGHLLLTASHNRNFGAKYLSGMVNSGGIVGDTTQPTFSFQYGYIEASIRIPGGRGLWPAFWMQPESTVTTGVDHSADGEIDIMDNGTGNPLVLHSGVIVNGTTFAQQKPGRLSPGFHTFGVDWQPDHITWYVDGKAWMTTTDTTLIPNTPMYPIVNLAVSDGTVWGSAPVAGTPIPTTMSVDYIRVWTH